jgi:hypothetical protein
MAVATETGWRSLLSLTYEENVKVTNKCTIVPHNRGLI